jgi:glycosyltransferase involved in cell wall biosynthesis
MSHLLRSFDGCTVVLEKSVEQPQLPCGSTAVIPNGVNLTDYQGDFGLPEAGTLIYSGLSPTANYGGSVLLAGDIPPIQAERPEVKFMTGSLDGVQIEALPRHEGVIFTGYLDDVRPWVARSWLQVVPLRSGGGTRLKVLESMAIGTPVVSTSKGAEGLDLQPGRDLLIADSPAAFASAVLMVLGDAPLRRELSRAGQQVVAGRYNWQLIGRQYNAYIESLVNRS